MAVIGNAALLLMGIVAAQPTNATPGTATLRVTVRQVVSMQALAGQTVEVSGRCLGNTAPALAYGSRPMSGGGVWQLEQNGVATWVVGEMPSGCASGEVVITAQVAQDALPRLSRPRSLQQYLVVQ